MCPPKSKGIPRLGAEKLCRPKNNYLKYFEFSDIFKMEK